MKTKYRIINKSNNTVITESRPYGVGVFLLGRRIDNYIIVKSDERGDRLMKLDSSDIQKIIESLKDQ